MANWVGNLSPEQRHLLNAIILPLAKTEGWPVFQHVEAQLDQIHDLNAAALLSSLPAVRSAWKQGPAYGLVWWQNWTTQPPPPATTLHLTIAGFSCLELGQPYVEQFLGILRYAAAAQRRVVTTPQQVVDAFVYADTMLNDLRDIGPLQSAAAMEQLREVLEMEPPFWGDVSNHPQHQWKIILRPHLRGYRDIPDVSDYLDRVGLWAEGEPVIRQRVVPSPFSLPASLEFLDFVWRDRYDRGLLGLSGPTKFAALAADCATNEEFNSRLSALGDVLGQLEIPGQTGSRLDRLQAGLRQVLPPETHDRVDEHIETLRRVRVLRAGGQHSDAARRAAEAFRALRVPYPPSDWGAAWNAVRSLTIDALDGIREELQAHPSA